MSRGNNTRGGFVRAPDLVSFEILSKSAVSALIVVIYANLLC